MNAALLDSILAFALRRGLSWVGLGGGMVTDETIGKVVGALIFLGNEGYQFYKLYKTTKVQGGVQTPR